MGRSAVEEEEKEDKHLIELLHGQPFFFVDG
jgi:hypothetical protein